MPLLPSKHIPLDLTVVGLGAFFIQSISRKPKEVENLWSIYRRSYNAGSIRANINFDQYLDIITFLYSIGAIELSENKLQICD